MSRERIKQEIQRLEKEIREALEKSEQEDKQDSQLVMFPETIDREIGDLQARLEKVKKACDNWRNGKPEAESKTFEKDQINFTDPG